MADKSSTFLETLGDVGDAFKTLLFCFYLNKFSAEHDVETQSFFKEVLL